MFLVVRAINDSFSGVGIYFLQVSTFSLLSVLSVAIALFRFHRQWLCRRKYFVTTLFYEGEVWTRRGVFSYSARCNSILTLDNVRMATRIWAESSRVGEISFSFPAFFPGRIWLFMWTATHIMRHVRNEWKIFQALEMLPSERESRSF